MSRVPQCTESVQTEATRAAPHRSIQQAQRSRARALSAPTLRVACSASRAHLLGRRPRCRYMMAHAEPCARMLARHAPCNACIRRCFHASCAPRSYQRARTARRVKRVRREHARARARCVRACARELRQRQQERVLAARFRTVRCRACGASRARRVSRAPIEVARRGVLSAVRSGRRHGGPALATELRDAARCGALRVEQLRGSSAAPRPASKRR